MQRRSVPPPPRHERKAFTYAEWRKLLVAARHGDQPRDEALISIIYEAGLRAGEVGLLTLECCQRLHKRWIYLHREKGSKSGWFQLSKQTQAVLLRWIQAVYPTRQARKPNLPLFPGERYRGATSAMSRFAVYRLVKRLCADAGLKVVNWPHALRHGRVRHILELGHKKGLSAEQMLPAVAAIVGHRSAWTTIVNYLSDLSGAGAAIRDVTDEALE